MQAVEHSGLWWVPSQPDNRVAGVLAYTEEDGLALNLIGSFSESGQSAGAGGEAVPVILGLIDRKYVALTDCISLGTSHSVPGFARDRFWARFAYLGSGPFPDPQNIKINSVIVQMTHLAAWAHILSGGKVGPAREPDGSVRYDISYRDPEKLPAVTPKGTITLEAGASLPLGFRREYTIRESVILRVTRDDPEDLEWWLAEVVNPLQNLLSLATNAPNAVTRLMATSPEISDETDTKTIPPLFDVIYQGRYTERPSEKSRERMPHEMLFTLKDVQDRFEEVVNAWFRVADELSEVCDVFFSTQYRSLYLEHHFSNMAQAAEGYHRASPRFSKAARRKKDDDPRIKDILTHCPEKHRAWLKKRLTGRGRKEPILQILVFYHFKQLTGAATPWFL